MVVGAAVMLDATYVCALVALVKSVLIVVDNISLS